MRFTNLDSWSVCRQQGRDLPASQVRLEARTEIVQHVALLLSAGGDHPQQPLHKPAAIGTVRPSTDPPSDHGMSQRAFRPVVRRLDPLDAHEAPQTFFHFEDLKACRGRLGATATPATFRRGLDRAPQSRCNRLEPRPINGPIADAVPPRRRFTSAPLPSPPSSSPSFSRRSR